MKPTELRCPGHNLQGEGVGRFRRQLHLARCSPGDVPQATNVGMQGVPTHGERSPPEMQVVEGEPAATNQQRITLQQPEEARPSLPFAARRPEGRGVRDLEGEPASDPLTGRGGCLNARCNY